VRTAVTDGQGRYNIVDLRPGVYDVTFTLVGFSTVRREGIQLSAGFTANVNAELRLGALEETITVSGQSPVVDVHNVRQQAVMTRDVLDTIPVGRSPNSYAVLVPGVIAASAATASGAQDVGGSTSDKNVALVIHGSRAQEMPLLFDGMKYNNMNATPGGSHHIWAVNNAVVQEYTVETGALSAEVEVSGVRQNAIPREGGNRFSGMFFTNYTNDSLQAQNVSDVTRATSFPKMWDINPAFGGPISSDKLWFFLSTRHWGTHQKLAGVFWDTDPNDWVYTPDLSRPGVEEVRLHGEDVRLTWQATPKNKLALWTAAHQRCWCHYTMSSTVQPDASAILRTPPNLMAQLTWASPITNRLLLDVGWTTHPERWTVYPQPWLAWGTWPANELSTGINFRAKNNYQDHRTLQNNSKFFLSYVTGTHAFKVGFQGQFGWRSIKRFTLGTPAALRFRNGVSDSLIQYNYPWLTRADVPHYDGAFVQDQWTIDRMTVNLGLRWEWLLSTVPAQTYPATLLVDERSYPEIRNAPNWKDVLPRVGVAYDVFGTGRTAVKVSLGRYVQAVSTAYSDQINPIVAGVDQATRTWNDANGNFFPDCDLKNVVTNGECGTLTNLAFGKGIITKTLDPDTFTGWGKRPYDWEMQTSIQHELIPGLSLNATYTRHWWRNFFAIDNALVSPSDYSPYCITAPSDPRLPGGGGNQICGFYDINPDKFGQVDEVITFAKNYGKDPDNVYDGVDVSVSTRLPSGILVQGGFHTGRQMWNNCDTVGKADTPGGGAIDIARTGISTPLLTNGTGISSPSQLYCHVSPPFQTQVKLLGAMPLPWDMTVSVAFQSVPGPQITAGYNVSSAAIAPSLGRPLSAGARASTTVHLIAPGTMYGDRVNQLDTRFAKTFRLAGGSRVQAQIDAYNLLNVAPVLTLNTTYGPRWQQPNAVLVGRMVKFGMQFNF